jgi:predicted enzyme related to lactoylglutathione lyase
MTATIKIVLDCRDPPALAQFWGPALGYTIAGSVENYTLLVPEADDGPKILLQKVPEPRPSKNRMHLDIDLETDTPTVDDEVRRLEGLGARRIVDDAFEEHGARWVVMADPEGNEFCVCRLAGT